MLCKCLIQCLRFVDLGLRSILMRCEQVKIGKYEVLVEHLLLKGNFYFYLFAGICVQHVDGAAQSGVVGAYQAPDIHRVVNIRYRYADQGLFNGASLSHIVPWVGVPDGGRCDLVIVYH